MASYEVKRVLYISLLLLFFISRPQRSIASARETSDADIYARSRHLKEAPAPNSHPSVVNACADPTDSRINQTCATAVIDWTDALQEIIAFNPDAGILYPGSIVTSTTGD